MSADDVVDLARRLADALEVQQQQQQQQNLYGSAAPQSEQQSSSDNDSKILLELRSQLATRGATQRERRFAAVARNDDELVRIRVTSDDSDSDSDDLDPSSFFVVRRSTLRRSPVLSRMTSDVSEDSAARFASPKRDPETGAICVNCPGGPGVFRVFLNVLRTGVIPTSLMRMERATQTMDDDGGDGDALDATLYSSMTCTLVGLSQAADFYGAEDVVRSCRFLLSLQKGGTGQAATDPSSAPDVLDASPSDSFSGAVSNPQLRVADAARGVSAYARFFLDTEAQQDVDESNADDVGAPSSENARRRSLFYELRLREDAARRRYLLLDNNNNNNNNTSAVPGTAGTDTPGNGGRRGLFEHLLPVFDDGGAGPNRSSNPESRRRRSGFVFADTADVEWLDARAPLILDTRRFCDRRGEPSVVASLADFRRHFFAAAPALEFLDWNNLFCAGGSVLGAALAGPSAQRELFGGSDVDLFIYGLDRDAAIGKIAHVVEVLRQHACGGEAPVVVRTARTVSVVSGFPHRHVQIILRLYESPAEVLLGFDLDCVGIGFGIGFDGTALSENVWCLPRTQRALNFRVNVADPSRQTYRTTSYEYRLYKYSRRGFGVAIPGFDRSSVSAEIYLQRFANLRGLARLLFLEERDFQFHVLDMGRRMAVEQWFQRHGFALSVDGFIPKKKKKNEPWDLSGNAGFRFGTAERAALAESNADEDAASHVKDYNCELFLPFTPLSDRESIWTRLHNLLAPRNSSNDYPRRRRPPPSSAGSEGNPKSPCFFVFGRGLADEVLDTAKFSPAEQLRRFPYFRAGRRGNAQGETASAIPVDVQIPRHIEFIGSLREYVQSLPEVEDDWLRAAYAYERPRPE
jgi:hypothetical protein